MKKAHKLLRRLLAVYRDEVVKRPFTKERSQLVDSCIFIIEEIENAKR